MSIACTLAKVLTDKQIKDQEKVVAEAQKKYAAALAKLEELMETRNELQSREIISAYNYYKNGRAKS